ncbi:MAG: hypothetical protein JWL59_2289 [Chthoniobacteraceae bacterium]|nr:hypothetical protein [Chthoniobacteraceae bacterium]
MNESVKVTLWNTEWAVPNGRRGQIIQSVLHHGDPELICVTEGFSGIFSMSGHTITSADDYGYPITQGRRKVLLWSKSPWKEVDQLGSSLMPGGRFISGTTQSPVGLVRIIGVCIPWQDAHVRSGRRNRQPWQDHLSFIAGLDELLPRGEFDMPTILLGDFNQRIPKGRQPGPVYDCLIQTLQDRLCVVTDGVIGEIGKPSIDHLVATSHFKASSVTGFSNVANDGTTMSDHFGLRISLGLKSMSE